MGLRHPLFCVQLAFELFKGLQIASANKSKCMNIYAKL